MTNIPLIILCGGRGKRLGKLSKKIPKPLVKIGKKTLIEQKLDYYKKIGIYNFYLCIGYKGNLIKKYLLKYPAEITFSDAGENSGILKRISKILPRVNKSCIISYGDTLAKIDLKKLYKFHNQSKSIITIVVSSIQNPFGIVEWDKKENVKKFIEKPKQNHFIGYAVINPKIFNYISSKIINLRDGQGLVKAIQILSYKKKVNIFKFEGLQFTVNSIKDLKEAKITFNKYFTF